MGAGAPSLQTGVSAVRRVAGGQWGLLGKDVRSVHWQHWQEGEGKFLLWGEQRRHNDLEVSEVMEVLPILATGYFHVTGEMLGSFGVGVSQLQGHQRGNVCSRLSLSFTARGAFPLLNVHVHNCWALVMLRETGDTWRALAQGWACARAEECILISQEQLFYVVALGHPLLLFSFDV